MKDYVVGFRIDRESQKVLLIEKQKPEWQKGLYNGIGGKVEAGESPAKAMVREFEEETGMLVEDWEHTVLLFGKKFSVSFFRSFGSVDEAKTTTDEKVLSLFLADFALFPIIPNLAWLIPLQLDNIEWPVIMRDAHVEEADHVNRS